MMALRLLANEGQGHATKVAGFAAGSALLCAVLAALPAAADNSWIQFGPVGQSTSQSSSGYDLDFVREWEANPPVGFTTVSKANIEATKVAISRYSEIVAAGGWGAVPEPPPKAKPDELMQAGTSDAAVPLLRTRLIATGELKNADTSSSYFDYDLEKAVKRYQAANGLAPTGVLDKRTVGALNVPADARLKQLKVNLGRLQQEASTLAKRYVMVNIPAAQIEAVENGQVVARYAGVVGKPDRPTPLLDSTITDLNFNPIWRLPPTVISEDLIPRGREMQSKGQDVLEKFKIDAYDGSGRKVDSGNINWAKVSPGTYSYSQQPGKENPLGFLKINFGNSHSVYMHDTPSDRIFGRNFRSASSGCIRVHNIAHLAQWLLVGNRGGTAENIAALKASGKRYDVRLKKPVQLHFSYITAWATEDGVVQFRRDLYQRDGVGAVAAAY